MKRRIPWTSRRRKTIAVSAEPQTTAVRRRPYAYLSRPSGELKYKDTSATGDVNSNGTITLINGIARGDDVAERVGRKIIMKSYQVNYTAYAAPAASTGLSTTGRIMIVYDKQANAAAPAITDVLVTATGFSLKNLNNSERFTILKDKLFVTMATAGQSDQQQSGRLYGKIHLPTMFNAGDAGTVADITTGALYVITCGNIGAGADDSECAFRARVRFYDA